MKTISVLALSLLLSAFTFAQKKELKAAEKAYDQEKYKEAKTIIDNLSKTIGSAENKYKAEYYYAKGHIYDVLAYKEPENKTYVQTAISSFKELIEFEKTYKKQHTKEATRILDKISSSLVNMAIEDNNNKKYKSASANVYMAYEASGNKDYLFYAASFAVNDKDYDTALKHYETLKKEGYKGVEFEYLATSKKSNQEEVFKTKALRDASVAAKTHVKPVDKITGTKEAEVVKNIALIYIQKGENDKAINAVKDARKINPDDLDLMLADANIQLKTGNREAAKKLMLEASNQDPENVELQYNLGVLTAETGDLKTARSYYEKAIALNPNHTNALNNLGIVILNEEEAIVNEMNDNLGNSKEQIKRFEELKSKRKNLYNEALPYLEASLKSDSSNITAAKTLMSVYSILEDTENFQKMKEIVNALKNNK